LPGYLGPYNSLVDVQLIVVYRDGKNDLERACLRRATPLRAALTKMENYYEVLPSRRQHRELDAEKPKEFSTLSPSLSWRRRRNFWSASTTACSALNSDTLGKPPGARHHFITVDKESPIGVPERRNFAHVKRETILNGRLNQFRTFDRKKSAGTILRSWGP